MKTITAVLAALGFSCGGTKPTPAPPRPTVDFSRVEQIAGTITEVQTIRVNASVDVDYANTLVPTSFDYHIVTIKPDLDENLRTFVMRSYTTESGPLIPLSPGTHLAGAYHPSNGQIPEYVLSRAGIVGVNRQKTI